MAKKRPNAPLPKAVAKALAERKQTADSEQLLADLIDVWGGTRKLALDIFGEFQAAGKGGMTRQRILEMFQRLILTNTTHEIGRAVKPSDMSDEELESVATEYLTRMTSDGRPAGPPAEETPRQEDGPRPGLPDPVPVGDGEGPGPGRPARRRGRPPGSPAAPASGPDPALDA
jgi:hypothetical protein